MFELRTTSKVKVLNIGTLVTKDRAVDELPGAQLSLRMLLPAAAMAMFDGRWPAILSEKAANAVQGALDGMEGAEPTTLAKHLKKTSLDYFQTGCTVIIDRGIGRKNSNIELDDVTVHSVSFKAPDSGGVELTCKIDAPALTDATRGTLSGLKATEIEMTLTGPVVDERQQQIPGTAGTDPNKAPAVPPEDATTAFVKANKGKVVTLDGKR